MYLLWICGILQLNFFLAHCQLLFIWRDDEIANNSYISYEDVTNRSSAIKCLTSNLASSSSSEHLTWIDEKGIIIPSDGCLYVTRGVNSLSLNRKRYCTPPFGLQRCSHNVTLHIIYIYIGNGSEKFGKLDSLVLTKFTLHTEPRVNPPEFTVTCQTQGGPAQTIDWEYNKTLVTHRQSKVILSTSHNSVYDNNLHVRGRLSGEYKCFVANSISISVGSETITVAGEPADFTAMVTMSNSTHVNISVSWTAPPDPVTGYVIYYQSQRGLVLNETVTGGGETHSLDGLQKGATYKISIVALSQHLPSLLVGPVTINAGPLMLVVTAPSYDYTHNIPFSLRCNVWAELDGHSLHTTIKWMRISQSNVTSQIMEETLDSYKCIPQFQTNFSHLLVNRNNSGCEHELGSGSYLSSSSPSVLGYQSVLNTTENSTDTVVTYRCQATTMNINIHSDITVYIEDNILSSQSISVSSVEKSASTAETSVSSFSVTEGVTVNHTHMGQSMIRHGVSISSNMYTPTMSTSATESTRISSCVQTTTVIHDTDDNKKKQSCTDSMCQVTAGGVGGVMFLIIVIQFVIIMLLCTQRRPAGREHSQGKVETYTNTAYGVVVRREDPEYDVIPPSYSQPTTTPDL